MMIWKKQGDFTKKKAKVAQRDFERWEDLFEREFGELEELIGDSVSTLRTRHLKTSCDEDATAQLCDVITSTEIERRIDRLMLKKRMELIKKNRIDKEEEIKNPAFASIKEDGSISDSYLQEEKESIGLLRKERIGEDTVLKVLSIPVVRLVRKAYIKRYYVLGIPFRTKVNEEYLEQRIRKKKHEMVMPLIRLLMLSDTQIEELHRNEIGTEKEQMDLYMELRRLEEMRIDYIKKRECTLGTVI